MSPVLTVIDLEFDIDNPGAIAFYTKLGFTQAGEKMSGGMYMKKERSQTVPL